MKREASIRQAGADRAHRVAQPAVRRVVVEPGVPRHQVVHGVELERSFDDPEVGFVGVSHGDPPGKRIGWVRAPRPMRQDLLRHRARVDLGTSIAAQLVAVQVLDRLDALLTERTAALRVKAARLRAALGAGIPGWSVPEPDGGLCLWAHLPLDDAAPYVRAAEAAGVVVMGGGVARADRGPDPHVRLCFDRSPHILDEAVLRLVAAWDGSAPA